MEALTLSDKAYKTLKEMIPTLDAGQHLSIRDFAHRMGMSYTPVREAFHRLRNEGLLEYSPNIGFFIPRMGLIDIMQIFQVRECIEVFVLDRAFDMLTDENVSNLKKYVELQEEYLSKGRMREYMRCDEDFHLEFFKVYNNPHFTNLIKTVRQQYLVCSQSIHRGGRTGIAEHKEIIDRIMARDKQNAVRLLEEHIVEAKQRMKEGYIAFID
jgi:DNA-binding GntR family transcriptional regulator